MIKIKTHPANEDFSPENIAQAIGFTTFLRVDAHEKLKTECFTLDEAKGAADIMVAQHPGREALIYANFRNGSSVPLPHAYLCPDRVELSAEPVAKLHGKVFAKKASAQKAAHRAGLTPTEFNIIETSPMSYEMEIIAMKTPAKPAPAAPAKPAKPTKAEREANKAAIADAANKAAAKVLGVRAEKRIEKAAAKSAKAAPKAAKAEAPAPTGGKKMEILAAAERGIVPAAPDFSAETHKRFRKQLARIVAMVEAKDIAGLEAETINPVSTSPRAMDKYRNLAVVALKAARH